MKLNIAFSTCPNDTFIFDALIHKKIDTEGLSFDVKLGDVEELNKLAFKADIDITKLSYHAYLYIQDKYKLLNSGSALGYGNGPLLISKKKVYHDEIKYLKIGIPGKHTTANLLLSIAYPEASNKVEYLFSDIEDAILDNEIDAGLIIHENRFTYQQKGLKKIIDLGELWENKTSQAIPLGGIVINRNIPEDVQKTFDRVLKRSLQFAFENPNEPYEYVKKYAQEMSQDVMYKHIKLYVNEFSLDLGEKGKSAINTLYNEAKKIGVVDNIRPDIFV